MPVMRQPARRVLAGSLLILALVAVAAGIFFLDDLIRALERRTTIVALLPAAPDLAPGAPVWIAGEHVGRVAAIEFLPTAAGEDERVALILEIPDRLRAHIGPDAYVRITSARLIGEPVVDLVVSAEPGPAIEPGDTLGGRLVLGREALMARAARLRARFDTLTASFRALGEAPALRDGRIDAVQRRFAGIARELDALRAASATGSLGLLLEDPMLRDRFDRLSVTTDELRTAIGDARADRTAELTRLRFAFGELASDADSLAAAIARLRGEPDRGTLGRLTADSALSLALRRLQSQLDSLVQEATSNPFKFVF